MCEKIFVFASAHKAVIAVMLIRPSTLRLKNNMSDSVNEFAIDIVALPIHPLRVHQMIS